MTLLVLITSFWLTLKVPFTVYMDNHEVEITQKELLPNHGGWSIPHKCTHCQKFDYISFDISGELVNMKDVLQVR